MTQEEVVGRLVDVLARLGVPHMVVGSFASNLHGVPRMTQDADVVIEADQAAALRIVQAALERAAASPIATKVERRGAPSGGRHGACVPWSPPRDRGLR